jgi:hypothetical protein
VIGGVVAANQIAVSDMLDADGKIIHPSFHLKAWQEGFCAGRLGRTGADNPYAGVGREARAWVRGFLEGRMKPLTIVLSTPISRKEPHLSPSTVGLWGGCGERQAGEG